MGFLIAGLAKMVSVENLLNRSPALPIQGSWLRTLVKATYSSFLRRQEP